MEPPHGGWRVVGLSSDTEESISEGLSAKATEPPLRTAARSQPGGRLREHAFASSREAFFLVKLRNHLKTKHSDLQKKEKKKKKTKMDNMFLLLLALRGYFWLQRSVIAVTGFSTE